MLEPFPYTHVLWGMLDRTHTEQGGGLPFTPPVSSLPVQPWPGPSPRWRVQRHPRKHSLLGLGEHLGLGVWAQAMRVRRGGFGASTPASGPSPDECLQPPHRCPHRTRCPVGHFLRMDLTSSGPAPTPTTLTSLSLSSFVTGLLPTKPHLFLGLGPVPHGSLPCLGPRVSVQHPLSFTDATIYPTSGVLAPSSAGWLRALQLPAPPSQVQSPCPF